MRIAETLAVAGSKKRGIRWIQTQERFREQLIKKRFGELGAARSRSGFNLNRFTLRSVRLIREEKLQPAGYAPDRKKRS